MKFKAKKKHQMFSSIEVPEVFLFRYFKDMPCETLKVYLYLLYLNKTEQDCDIQEICNETQISPKIVKTSIDYLQEKGLLVASVDGFILIDLQEKELTSLYKPNNKVSMQQLKEVVETDAKKQLIDTIESQYFGGNMKADWYKKIIYWQDTYQLTDDAILAIFAHCFMQDAKPIAYVDTVIKAMSSKGVKTYKDFEKQMILQEKKNKMIKIVKYQLGIMKPLTKPQEAMVEKWTSVYKYNEKIIEFLVQKTVNIQSCSFSYLDKILTSWHEAGLKTLTDIKKHEEESKKERETKAKKTTTKKEKEAKDEGREQRVFEDLDSFLM